MRGKGLRSRLTTKLGRKVAVRMVGVIVATAGLALLGVGTISSPLAAGHVKLAAVTSNEGGNDNCQGQEAPVSSNEEDQTTCTTSSSSSSSSKSTKSCTSEDAAVSDEDTSCTTSSSSSSSSKSTKSCHTSEDAAVSDDDTTCTTSSSSSSSSHSSSSAASSATSSAASGGSTSTMTTAVLGVATQTPSTGADVEFGAGLALMFAGGGLVAAAARLGRKQKS